MCCLANPYGGGAAEGWGLWRVPDITVTVTRTVAADCGERTVSPPVRAPGAGTGDDAVREDASMAQRETDALVAAQRQ